MADRCGNRSEAMARRWRSGRGALAAHRLPPALQLLTRHGPAVVSLRRPEMAMALLLALSWRAARAPRRRRLLQPEATSQLPLAWHSTSAADPV